MQVGERNFSTLWLEKKKVKIIDQRKLPFELVVKELKTLQQFCFAIKEMQVRGAPLIGVTAAFGFATAIQEDSSDSNIERSYKALFNTRPTAINLKWALDLIKNKLKKVKKSEKAFKSFELAKIIRDNDIINCQKIALNGYKIIHDIFKKKKRRINILTHCNAGWLATIDWGTALAPIFLANRNKIPIHVWVDETRPRNQGALLTAWELKNENVPYTIIVDNAGGHLMQNKKVDLCIVGSDRTTKDGHVCNKIGTYLKALCAFDNNIPFYVALPSSTIDCNISLSKVPIEERSGKELSHLLFQKNGKIFNGNIYFKDSKTFNPAFDITPSKYITKLITENGVFTPKRSEIKKCILNG
ncbi:MAG: S-methyl-5-thioribose-1-phosphate isomerase [Pseudomonadota bacterium]|nr:S-methyl-5-thioribose-1-phosphate isomerase [Pseudomonadota bacterium]